MPRGGAYLQGRGELQLLGPHALDGLKGERTQVQTLHYRCRCNEPSWVPRSLRQSQPGSFFKDVSAGAPLGSVIDHLIHRTRRQELAPRALVAGLAAALAS